MVFDGVLHNRLEMAERLGVDPRVGNAELLAVAYRRWGLDLPRHLSHFTPDTLARRVRIVLAGVRG